MIYFNGSGPLNFDAYKQIGYVFLAGFPDIAVAVLDQIEQDDKVVSRVHWSGTHAGEFNGIPTTGRPFHNEDITISFNKIKHGCLAVILVHAGVTAERS